WSDKKVEGSALWGDNMQLAGNGGDSVILTVVNPVNASTTTRPSGGGIPGLFTNPWFDAAPVGGATTGPLIAQSGSSNTTPGGTLPGGSGIPDEATRVNQTFTIAVNVSPSASCFGNSTGPITFSGNATATVATFGGPLATLPQLNGSVATGTSAFTFTG